MKNLLKRVFGRHRSGEISEFGNREGINRLIFFVDAIGATFKISFLLPLEEDLRTGRLFIKIYTQADVKNLILEDRIAELWSDLDRLNPASVIFSRYGGDLYREISAFARARKKKIVFHLDDNLYALPPDLGAVYHQRHLAAPVVECREFLARSADLVYCSTKPLENLMRSKFAINNTFSGIYCAYPGPMGPMDYRESRILGYMGTKSHQRDLDLALPGVYAFLAGNPSWKFELFGDFADIQHPAQLQERIQVLPPVRDYVEFRRFLSSRGWQAGLLPLQSDEFNQVKAPTKFVEYTASGMVSLATPFGPYGTLVEKGAAVGILDWRDLDKELNNRRKLQETHRLACDYCERNFASQELTQQVRHLLLD